MFALVVSVNDELIVSDVAVDERVTLVPATKFVGPNGTYPRAFVMFRAVNEAELNGTYPRLICGMYPKAFVMLAALNEAELNGVYPRAVVMLAALNEAELNGVYPRAVVMSDDDKENVAVRFDRPSLVRVRVLIVEAVSANEIAVT